MYIIYGISYTLLVESRKKNTDTLVVASKESELEVNADKTKYMVFFWHQDAGQNHNIKTDNSSFERVKEFIYLGTTLISQNCIQEEIKIRLNLGNACCQSVQNILCSIMLSKNTKIKIYRTTVLNVVLYWCVVLGHAHWWRNIGWWCLRIGQWGEYLGLRGMR